VKAEAEIEENLFCEKRMKKRYAEMSEEKRRNESY